ncbi:MAG: DUF2206 domain-containing protein [Dehalococcoidia bacterium]|nr:DUF2206 domain-containing protein [Dehalococcoidia bacterium]
MNFPNDWEIKKCLQLSLAILLAMLVLIGLAALGFDIPVLRQIISFVFLTFIPGILILRILRVHNISTIESLVYSVGLSVAFTMFSGALINFTLPLIDIPKPISLAPVSVTLAVFTLILMAVAYMRDRAFVGQQKTKLSKKLQLPPVLFLILLLLLTVLSVALIDAYQNNILLLVCLIAIAAVVGLAAFGKFIQPQVYPLAIFIIGLCLLYQTTLMSPYLIGSDIYVEHHFWRLVVGSGFWDASIPSTVNSCTSTNILAPVYSLLLNIDGVWVFKVIYPLLFSLMPLVMYHIFSQQMSSKKAFLAVFFFLSVPTFSLEMISLCRQQIAELFFVLFILLLVDRKLSLSSKLPLVIIFVMSIPVSHYSLGMIGLIYMGLFLPLVFIIRNGTFQKLWGWLTKKVGGLPRSLTKLQVLPAKIIVITVVVYFIFSFVWFGIIASGVNLNLVKSLWAWQTGGIVTEVSQITTELSQTEPAQTGPGQTKPGQAKPGQAKPGYTPAGARLDPLMNTALGLDFPQASPQGKGFRIFQYITQLFLIVGCLRLIFRPKHLRFTAEYIAISLVSALLILACIFLPGFAPGLNTTRWYHITLITLAPFCILGGEAIWLGVISLWRKLRHIVRGMSLRAEAKQPSLAEAEDSQGALKFIALAVLIPYFLFNLGFIYEITGMQVTDKIDTPYSIALSSYRLDLAGVFYWRDGAAAEWLIAKKSDDSAKIYVDSHAAKLLYAGFSEDPRLSGALYSPQLAGFPPNATELQEDNYVYFTAWNIDKKELTFAIGPGLRRHCSFADIPGLTRAIENKNRIYNNDGAQVLR